MEGEWCGLGLHREIPSELCLVWRAGMLFFRQSAQLGAAGSPPKCLRVPYDDSGEARDACNLAVDAHV